MVLNSVSRESRLVKPGFSINGRDERLARPPMAGLVLYFIPLLENTLIGTAVHQGRKLTPHFAAYRDLLTAVARYKENIHMHQQRLPNSNPVTF